MDAATLDQYWTLILLAAIWELAWKGVALWKAARADDKVWYVVILVVNTLGILPLLYILLRKQPKQQPA